MGTDPIGTKGAEGNRIVGWRPGTKNPASSPARPAGGRAQCPQGGRVGGPPRGGGRGGGAAPGRHGGGGAVRGLAAAGVAPAMGVNVGALLRRYTRVVRATQVKERRVRDRGLR